MQEGRRAQPKHCFYTRRASLLMDQSGKRLFSSDLRAGYFGEKKPHMHLRSHVFDPRLSYMGLTRPFFLIAPFSKTRKAAVFPCMIRISLSAQEKITCEGRFQPS